MYKTIIIIVTLVSLEVHGSKISFYRNIFLSQYRNIVRQNVPCELGLKNIDYGIVVTKLLTPSSRIVTSFMDNL